MLERVTTWEIEDLGVVEDWVYDIEVEDCHNFFANDILVHNSIYLNFETLVNKVCPPDMDKQKIVDFLDRFVKKFIEPFIDSEFKVMSDYLNFSTNKLSMKREAIADKVIWRGKKNYILQVYDSEGVRYLKPKIKVAGLESVRSAVPKLSRKALVKCYNILLNGTEAELIQFVKEFKSEFMTSPVVDVAFPRGVNDMDKWIDGLSWRSGTPIHVKASITYNKLLKSLKLDSKHPLIKNGDKIRFVYLKSPNPLHTNAISFTEKLHPEFNLDEYIDRKTQYIKTFLHPLETVAVLVGFDTEVRARVNDFFSDSEEDSEAVKQWGRIVPVSVAVPDPAIRTIVSKDTKPKKVTKSRKKEPISLSNFFE